MKRETYLDHYPQCKGCPVSDYCGTMVGSIKLCHSYESEYNLYMDFLDEWMEEMSELMDEAFYAAMAEEYEAEEEYLDAEADYWAEVMNDIRWMSKHC